MIWTDLWTLPCAPWEPFSGFITSCVRMYGTDILCCTGNFRMDCLSVIFFFFAAFWLSYFFSDRNPCQSFIYLFQCRPIGTICLLSCCYLTEGIQLLKIEPEDLGYWYLGVNAVLGLLLHCPKQTTITEWQMEFYFFHSKRLSLWTTQL